MPTRGSELRKRPSEAESGIKISVCCLNYWPVLGFQRRICNLQSERASIRRDLHILAGCGKTRFDNFNFALWKLFLGNLAIVSRDISDDGKLSRNLWRLPVETAGHFTWFTRFWTLMLSVLKLENGDYSDFIHFLLLLLKLWWWKIHQVELLTSSSPYIFYIFINQLSNFLVKIEVIKFL